MSNQNERAEALFQELSKNKKKKKQKTFRTVLIVILVVAVALVMVFNHLRQQVEDRFEAMANDVQSYAATVGTINTTVTGSGVLEEVGLDAITVPAGVEITEVLVDADTLVSTGDVLATVDLNSVLDAMASVQSALDSLDSRIEDARGDSVAGEVTAGVTGRVKIIYAEEGEDVVRCMADHGALAVLSLDGFLAVDITSGALTAGDPVTVVLADGTDIDGTVEKVTDGVATVLVTDKGPKNDEKVTVLTQNSTEVGSGMLYIHSPLAVTGYTGTVRDIYVEENDRVEDYYWLFYLEDSGVSANYDSLLRQRAEQEELLMELLKLYRDGAVLSPMDGLVSSVEYGEETAEPQTDSNAGYGTTAQSDYAAMTQSGGFTMPQSGTTAGSQDTGAQTAATETALLTIYPNVRMSITVGIDEMDILALEVGQEADVTVSSVSEDTVYTGVVTEVIKTANTTSGATRYSAVVELDKVVGMLPGMTADVDVKIQGVDNAILIPVEALHQTSTIYYVYTSYDEETMQYSGRVEVTIGMQNSNFVEITSGLSEGDTVYYTEEQDFSWMFGGMGGNMPGGFGNRGG